MSKYLTFCLALLSLAGSRAQAQCPNNNVFYETLSAPTTATPKFTELYGGEYTTVTGMQAGTTYRISNCGDGAFDSEITIYPSGGSIIPEAYNDDYETCAPQSTIYFTPRTTGSYDILADLYSCTDYTAAYTTIDIEVVEQPVELVVIPVVVHVVYNNAVENISTAQIQSQIDVLNADFRRLNVDIASTPSRFRGFSKDTRIEFCLASVDPNSNSTTGITRTSTNHGPFSSNNDDMKFASQGGHDVWDRDSYLNFWVCDLDGGTLGYAQFPNMAASTDGVVIDYQYFGTMGTATPPFNLGRTATHEVGHWLNLRHIWGDDGGACSGSDFVEDTPNQGGPNYGCPTSAPSSCSNEGNGGDMYVDYMDYSDDACLSMFSYWQHRRMRTALDGPRGSLKNSGGCGQNVSGRDPVEPKLELEVFPNPARDQVTFIVRGLPPSTKGFQLRIFDTMGRELNRFADLKSHEFSIGTAHLNPGVYFYYLEASQGTGSQGRLIIQ